MDRAIPSGSKICSRRMEERAREVHRAKILSARATVDCHEPHAARMDHVRNNLKREQKLEERYSEIDRDNRLLLKKMSDIMKPAAPASASGPTPPLSARSAGPTSLNSSARKKELLRITQENQHLLKRIQQAQPVYNHVELENQGRKNLAYLKNCAEYPLVLRTPRKPVNESSVLVPLSTDSALPSAKAAAACMRPLTLPQASTVPAVVQDVKPVQEQFVLKEGRQIGGRYFLVEMSTDGRALNVSAYDGASQLSLELVVKEKEHRRLYRDAGGDYSLIAELLQIDGDRLRLGDNCSSQGIVSAERTVAAHPPAEAEAEEEAPEVHGRPVTVPEQEFDADSMVQVMAQTVTSGFSVFGADIRLNSQGDPQVRIHGLTPDSHLGRTGASTPPGTA